ncbi:MAG: LysR family transcriptional regulator [Acidobacteria bacterium]|nr:MAG: LysR family transcriptional regulator [Acidobacteriota bacterium]
MNLDQIRNFYEVAVHKSFTQAAEKLYRTQPAISTQVRILEEELGEKLFDRIGKKVCLTQAGEILFTYAERLLRLHDEAKLAITELNASPKGKILIGANEATCIYVLPQIFALFKREYPDVQISIYRNFSKKVVDKILDNQLDFGIVTLPVADRDLYVWPIAEDELWLITSPSHPLASREAINLNELVPYPMIFHKAGTTRERLMKHFGKLGDKLNISMELASIETIKKFVSIGMGISIVPKSYVLNESEQGTLRLIRIKNLKMIRKLGLIYRKNRYLSRACKAFLEVVEESLREEKAV